MSLQPELIANAPLENMSVKDLKLDVDNVRFTHLEENPTPEEIEEIIRKDPDTSDLYKQILSAGVIYEPLLIRPDNVVVEGNRRLVCLRSILKQVEEKKLDKYHEEKFETVKCRILPEDVDNKSIDIYLAGIHVKAKKPWKKFNRANHIYNLNRRHSISYERLAQELGMGKTTIKRCVDVYTMVLNYARKYPDDKSWFHKFTYFDFLFQRKDLKEIRERRGFVEDFGSWVHQKKISDVRDVYKLSQVVSDPESFQMLKKKNFTEALKVLGKKDPSVNIAEFKKIKEAAKALDDIQKMDLFEIIADSEKKKVLINLESKIKNLMADIDSLRIKKEVILTR